MDMFVGYLLMLAIATVGLILHIRDAASVFVRHGRQYARIEAWALKFVCAGSLVTLVGLALSWALLIGTTPAFGLTGLLPRWITRLVSFDSWFPLVFGIIGAAQLGFLMLATTRSADRTLRRSCLWAAIASLFTCAMLCAWAGIY